MTRWDVERAILASDLPAPARLVALSLLTYTDRGGTVVSRQHGPSLAVLAGATGLGRSTVAASLARLEGLGWVRREAISGRRTRYTLCAPSTALSTTGPSPGPAPSTTSPGGGPIPVQEMDPSGPSPGPEGSRSGTTPVQELHWTRPGDGHSPEGKPESSQLARGPAREATPRGTQIVIHKTGATEPEAAAVVRAIEAQRRPRSLVGLIHRLAQDGELSAWLDEVRAAQRRRDAPACPRHRGQLADHCAYCRGEALGTAA